MTTAYTSLLGFALPVTGELSGTWGDTVNNGITSLLDSAIAGTTTLSADSDVTLTTTQGSSNTAREAILLWTAGGSATRTITAPAQSKIYTVINASSGTQSIILAGAGPTSGVTIAKGESALCAWNGSDFIKISNTAGPGTFTNLTVTGNTSLGDADTDTITQAASYVTGTQLKSAKTATNTLSLAAYDVDGTAYTNLITLTASNTPTLALTSTGVGTINNMSIGATTASTGAFTTLSATGNTTLGDASTDTVTVNGYMGVGGAVDASYGIRIASSTLTTTGQYGIYAEPTGTSAATGVIAAIATQPKTAAVAYTAATVQGLRVNDATKGAGSTITELYGIRILDQTQGTTNYGITSAVSSGSNKWNIYASGTAANYFAGNVGIGTSSPGSLLHLNANNAALRLSEAGTYYGSIQVDSAGGLTIASDPTNVAANSRLIFGVDGSERMRIDSSGNVGIGTSSPSGKFHVTGSAGSTYITSAGNQVVFTRDSANYISASGGSSSLLIFETGGPNERMRIDSSGNLGLGVAPSAWSFGGNFDLAADQNIFAGATALGVGINAYYNGGWKYKGTGYSSYIKQESGTFKWFTAASGTAGNAITFTQAMTLNASGNLGIGTSSPVAPLHVNYTSSGMAPRISGSGLARFDLEDLDQADGSRPFQYLSSDGGSLIFGNANRSGTSTTSSVERARIDSSGNVQVQAGAVMPYAPAPAAISAAATLTNANIQAQIISATGTTYTITMPLGTTLETLATWATTGIAYDFFVINTASGTVTMAVNTGVTSLGTLTIATGVSAQFRIRRTAANTFVLYRLG